MKHTFANKLTFAMLIMALAIISGAGAFAASEDEAMIPFRRKIRPMCALSMPNRKSPNCPQGERQGT